MRVGGKASHESHKLDKAGAIPAPATKEKMKPKTEFCPKCNKISTLIPIGKYGTDNEKYRCSNCRRIVLDRNTRMRLSNKASWK